MHAKKILAIIIAASVCAFLLTSNLVNAADLSKALSTLSQNDEWAIMANAARGKTVGQSFLRSSISGGSATDYEKRILAITAISGNPRTFGSEDFLAKLESKFDGKQIGDRSLINDDIFGILALKSARISNNTVSKSRQFILSEQNSDGGWGYATNVSSDSNMTAMAIAALSLTGSVPSSAYSYISKTQDSSGGYGFTPGQAADGASTAWVIMGLNTANRSVPSSAKSFLENLQTSNGSFKWKPADSSGSSLVTAYAVIALSGKGIPVRISTSTPSNPSPAPSPSPTPSPNPSPSPSPTPTPSPISSNPACYVPVFHTNFLFPQEGGKIIKIQEQMYFVPNLPSCANVSGTAVSTPSSTPSSSPSPTPSPSPSANPFSNTCLVPVFHTNFLFPLEGGRIIKIQEQMYFVPNLPSCANVSGTAINTTVSSSSGFTTSSSIDIKINHPSRMIFQGQIAFDSSQTALSALQKAANQNNFSLDVQNTSLGTYVASIAGFAASGNSGWQYAVNGLVADKPASDYSLQADDNLQWFYGSVGSNPY